MRGRRRRFSPCSRRGFGRASHSRSRSPPGWSRPPSCLSCRRGALCSWWPCSSPSTACSGCRDDLGRPRRPVPRVPPAPSCRSRRSPAGRRADRSPAGRSAGGVIRPGDGRLRGGCRHARHGGPDHVGAERPARSAGAPGGRVVIQVEVARDATPALHAALARLLPQLNATLELPDLQRLERMLADPAVTLLLARDREDVVGTPPVIVYTTPFWIKARLDEVVVDASARGNGVAEALVKAALDIGRQRGAQVAELQSGRGPARDAAHRLYLKLGFAIRETDVMRLVL